MADVAHHRVPGAGVELHVVSAGRDDAAALVLLHGWPDSWRCWEPILPLLAEEFHLLAIDQRGFGESEMPRGTEAYSMRLAVADVTTVLDHFGICRVGLVGHDFGGAVGWAAAVLAPDRIERAVILASPHPLRLRAAAIENPSQLERSFYVWLLHLGARGEALLAGGGFRRLADWAFGGSRVPPEVVDDHVRQWAQPGRFHAMAEWYRASFPPELFDPDRPLHLPPCPIPVRYVHGGRDLAFVPEAATGSARFVDAESDEVVIDDASHWLTWDAPDQVAGLIREWMTRR